MNKSDLIEVVAQHAGLNKSQATRAVSCVLEGIEHQLMCGGSVVLTGFGTFTVASRAERTGRNPRTGEPVKIAASRTAKFSPGKGLKDNLN